MRSVILAFAPVMLSASLSAQGVFSNKTQVILEKVIQDYPNHFTNIKGELISQALQTSSYKSTLELPGAKSSTVTLVTTSGTEGSGWTCTILRTTDFEQARARFSEIYGQLSNCIILGAGQKTFIINGQYETPTPDKKDNEVIFTLLPGVGEMKKLRVGLLLHAEGDAWTLSLGVNDDYPEMRQLAVNGR